MSRFSVETSLKNPQTSTPQGQSQYDLSTWPKVFSKETIGIERHGVILRNQSTPNNIEELDVIPESLEAIRLMRLKGYRVCIFFNEPLISEGKMTTDLVDKTNQKLMEIFGQAGIFSIDGLLYSTTSFKDDIYSMPNNGMLKKAEKDFRVKFKGGYFVGDKLHDLKVADSVGARPILIRTGEFEITEEKLKTFANRQLKNKVKSFYSLLDFANSLL
jgi:D-glycero-D-manno-heptose 1,7-bisphosphate phosphatase